MSIDKSASFMQSLCLGNIEESIILPFPTMRADEKETLHSVIEAVDSLLGERGEDFRRWDREGEMPPEFLEEMRQFGLFGLVIPEEYGGMGFGSAAYSRAIQQVARHDGSVTVTIGAHSSIGMRGLLLFGTDDQKQRYLARLASGEMIAAFCLTEPSAGSDAAAIKSRAVHDGDDWILNGSKLWITNGGIADFFTVFAKSDDDERNGITAFIVTRDMEGVSVGPHEDKMGLRASATNSVYFDNVRIPAQNVLGPVGKGFKVAMSILNSGRTGLGGGAVGMMKKLIELSCAQASERKQFGKELREFGIIKLKMGKMVADCYAAESVVSMVAGLIDQGYEDYATEAAISKVFASEALWTIADEALQIAGGNGYMCEFPYERMLRDARINRIFEGTNEILRLFIALTAMKQVGAELSELAASLKGVFDAPIQGIGVLSQYVIRRASLVTGIDRAKSNFTKLHPLLQSSAEAYEDSVRDLATAADRILRKHGKKVVEKQVATKRLANIMIDLFVGASVLSRVDSAIREKGPDEAAKEIQIQRVFMHQARRRIRYNFSLIDMNDDEEIKAIGDQAFERGRYGWDTI